MNLHALCQPLDKAVTCKLQVSMTWALKPSDKAVTANSESVFSVGELNYQVIVNVWTVTQERKRPTYHWIPPSYNTWPVVLT